MTQPKFARDLIRAARRARLPVRSRSEAGFTLIELMVSALIIVIIAAGVAQALIAGAHMTGYQRHRSQADQLAQQDQERLRGLSTKQLDGLSQTQTASLDGTVYTVNSVATFLNSTGGASCGSTGPGAAAYYSTSSTASWHDVNGTQSVKEDSIITPPAGGSMIVQVLDQLSNPLSGVGVTATGPDVESNSTGSTGCVVLGDLAEGSYTISIADPGYVDPNGNPSPLSTTATVTGTGTAGPALGNPVRMGLPGTIAASFATAGASGTLSAQSADALSWYGSGATTSMNTSQSVSATPSGATATGFSANNLFPFASSGSYANNYQVWAGPCRQMEPPAGQPGTVATVGPGTSQPLVVQEPAINLGVTYGGAVVQPSHIRVSFASASGTACNPPTWSVPVAAPATGGGPPANGWMSTPGQPFASTATSGASQSASGLTGTLSVCADYMTGTGTHAGYRSLTLPNLTNTNFGSPTAYTVAIPSSLNATSACP